MRPEILAPAGGMEQLGAAVLSGADAVYLGHTRFSARGNAANFGDGELAAALSYCHRREVKVYLALNTLLAGSELREAAALVETACRLPVDAVIVQDLGVAALIRECAPGMPIHASTQMSVHTPSGLRELQRMGVSRVILARELAKDELRDIIRTAGELQMETEIFVHGALCMSVSGQCYMSGMIGRRSGNRGLCAGTCRLPFESGQGDGYALSLKDLSLLSHLQELAEMGVGAFKIEGRMKGPEYVASAVHEIIQAVDNDNNITSGRKKLERVFSRSGFTDGFLNGRFDRSNFGVRSKEDMADTRDTLSSVHELYRRERPRIPVDFILRMEADQPALLTAAYQSCRAAAEGPVPVRAIRPVSRDYLASVIGKTGGTQFYLNAFSLQGEGLTLPSGDLKQMRRQALMKLEDKIGRREPLRFIQPRPFRPQSGGHDGSPPKWIGRFRTAEQMPAMERSGLAAVILPLDTDTSKIKSLQEKSVPVIVEIPRGMFDRDDAVAGRLAVLRKAGVTGAFCNNLGAVYLARRADMHIHMGFGMNLFNIKAVEAAAGMDARSVLLSFELPFSKIKDVPFVVPRGVITYGRVPLMLARACPIRQGADDCKSCDGGGSLTDRLGTKFPVVCRQGCAEVLNSRPIWLADRLSELPALEYHLFYFTLEDRAACEEVIRRYREEMPPPGNFTRGLYYRGVL